MILLMFIIWTHYVFSFLIFKTFVIIFHFLFDSNNLGERLIFSWQWCMKLFKN